MRRGRGELEVLEERTLLERERGRDRLRVTHTRARTERGEVIEWWSIRCFWIDHDGTWKAGKAGVTIRKNELASIAEVLLAAAGRSGT